MTNPKEELIILMVELKQCEAKFLQRALGVKHESIRTTLVAIAKGYSTIYKELEQIIKRNNL